jgi:hypothetical protein
VDETAPGRCELFLLLNEGSNLQEAKRMKRFPVLLSCLLFVLISPTLSVSAQGEMFDGRPVFAEGADFGYFLWRDGNKWHVRWTTKGRLRVFSGYVESTGGKLKSLKRIDVEEERRVVAPGRAPTVWVGPRGRVHSRGGRAPVVVERKQDRIEKEGDNRIVFTARTDNDIDGYDFELGEGVTSLRFVLEIDGRQNPRAVEIGRNNKKPPQLPLVVKIS